MSSFVISTVTTAGQVLESNEFGLIAAAGAILSPVGTAVTMSGSSTLITYGAVAATTAGAVVLNAVTATSVTIAPTGSIIAGGINLPAVSGSFSGNFALSNGGTISGGQAVTLSAAAGNSQINLGNEGHLQGLGNTAGAALSLALNNTSRAIITNNGTLATAGTGATVNITGAGTVTLTNTGQLLNASALEAAIQVDGALTLRNSGLIEGNVSATLSGNIFNSGTINGHIRLNSNNDVVRVSGLVMGDVVLGNGTNIFWQTGGRVMGTVSGGAGNDTYNIDAPGIVLFDTSGGLDVVNASCDFRLSFGIENLNLIGARGMLGIGNRLDNVIVGDSGDDSLRGLAGNDNLDGGAGNNRLQGGSQHDTLRAGEGDDFLHGGSGDDVLYMGYGNDTLNGGPGIDTLRFDIIDDPNGVTANLATRFYSFVNMGGLTITNMENLWGTAQADRLTGDAFANVLTGMGGADLLVGLEGNDTLDGDARADTLTGGAGADVFLYGAFTDSNTALGIDLITDFTQGQDVIDLRLIDPVAGGTDDAFVWLGTGAFTGTQAEVRWYHSGSTTVIELRQPGVAVNDSQIVLEGLITLSSADLLL